MTAVDHGFASQGHSIDAEGLSASPRLFENALLDKLSRVHWSMPLFVYVPVIAALVAITFRRVAPLEAAAMIALGYAIWTLIEYFGHRYLFHWEFPGAFGRRMHFLIHGVHHDHPNDPLRLVMPILLSGPIMIIAWFVATLLFGDTLRFPALAGFVTGYLTYDMVHFYTHHATPTTKLGMTLRRLHLMHHYRDHDKGFGVSAPYWDVVFGTAERRKRR